MIITLIGKMAQMAADEGRADNAEMYKCPFHIYV